MPDGRFSAFAAIDWSGAKGSRHRGIAVALAAADTRAPPVLVPAPGGVWSREGVGRWLLDAGARTPILFGFDFSFAPPLVARGAYLPGDPGVPAAARPLWAYIDRLCAEEPDLGAATFLTHHHRRHFYFGAGDGAKAAYTHLRRCEARLLATGGGRPSSVYEAIGAAQVGKASFAGMRLLHALGQEVPVWPIDGHAPPATGSLVVEIYTGIAARAAGRPRGRSKIRDAVALDTALAALGSDAHAPLARYDDHATDALVTAAWLRHVAHDAALWSPPDLTPEVARTEGWTLGVV